MITLKPHSKRINQYSDIDKFFLVPKKNWDDFPPGAIELKLNGQKTSLRVYDVPCDCSGERHSHRLVDLRNIWEKMQLEDGKGLEIER